MDINDINIIGHLADMKDTDYKNTLAVAALIELLIDKGIITRQEFARRAHELDTSGLLARDCSFKSVRSPHPTSLRSR